MVCCQIERRTQIHNKQCKLRVCHENTVTGRLTKNERQKKVAYEAWERKAAEQANEQNTLAELFLHHTHI